MFKILVFMFLIFSITNDCCATLIMINPAGHAKDVGRKLIEDFERSLTYKIAIALKDKIISTYHINVVITRDPGEEIVELQNASFANRLNVDFYLDIRVFRQDTIKPKIFIYYLIYNPMIDLAPRTFDPYKFIPVNQAHFININKTKSYGQKIKDFLNDDKYKRNFDTYGVFGIPIKFLKGITAPALCIEIGICNQDQWKNLVEPLVQSFYFLAN